MPSPTRSVVLGACVSLMLFAFSGLPAIGACVLCIGFLSPGLATVWHYSKAADGRLAAMDGVRLGAQSGLLGFAMLILLSTLSWLLSGRPDLMGPVIEQMQADESGLLAIIVASAPEGEDPMAEFESMMRSPLFGLLSALMLAGLLSLGGAIGGALGSTVFGRTVSDDEL